MYLSKNLKTIRKKWRLQQGDFAELMSSKRGRISSYEIDASEPSIEFMVRLENMSGVPIKDIYTRFVKLEEVAAQPIPESEWEQTKVTSSDKNDLVEQLEKIKEMVRRLDEDIKKKG